MTLAPGLIINLKTADSSIDNLTTSFTIVAASATSFQLTVNLLFTNVEFITASTVKPDNYLDHKLYLHQGSVVGGFPVYDISFDQIVPEYTGTSAQMKVNIKNAGGKTGSGSGI